MRTILVSPCIINGPPISLIIVLSSHHCRKALHECTRPRYRQGILLALAESSKLASETMPHRIPLRESRATVLMSDISPSKSFHKLVSVPTQQLAAHLCGNRSFTLNHQPKLPVSCSFLTSQMLVSHLHRNISLDASPPNSNHTFPPKESIHKISGVGRTWTGYCNSGLRNRNQTTVHYPLVSDTWDRITE